MEKDSFCFAKFFNIFMKRGVEWHEYWIAHSLFDINILIRSAPLSYKDPKVKRLDTREKIAT